MNIMKNALTLLLSTIILTGCGADKTKEQKTPEATIEKTVKTSTEEKAPDEKQLPANAPTYKVGIFLNFEPYSFRGEKNQITGFNIDLTNAVAAEGGFKVDYMTMKWDPTFAVIKSGKFDFIASSVAVLPERDKIIDYSNEYITTSIDLVVKDTLKDKSFDQIIADDTIRYALIPDTSFSKYALKTGIKENMIEDTQSSFLSLHAVLNGSVDATLADGQSLKYYAKQYPDMNIVHSTNDISKHAYVVKEGNAEMQDILNATLETLHQNGEYDKVYNKWFGK